MATRRAGSRKFLIRGYGFMLVVPLTPCGQGIETPLMENQGVTSLKVSGTFLFFCPARSAGTSAWMGRRGSVGAARNVRANGSRITHASHRRGTTVAMVAVDAVVKRRAPAMGYVLFEYHIHR